MGTAFEPEQDGGNSPVEAGHRGSEAQPLHESMQSKSGSRGGWAGSASGGLGK